MKPHTEWSYAPYTPLMFDSGSPYICQVLPKKDSVYFAWLPVEGEAEYTVLFGKRGEELKAIGRTEKPEFTVNGLADDTEYAFQVTAGANKSRIRLARTGSIPGICVNYLHPEDGCYSFSGQYLCSPSLVRHPDGFLLASMDVYKAEAPQCLTLIFRSDDDGESWHYVSELHPCFWGKLFIHRNKLYMLSCSTEYGELLIGCSEDGGKTFSPPTVLWRGSGMACLPGVHKNPQPVAEYNHRLWNTLEWGCWKCGTHSPMVMSADVDADLLKPESWSLTPPVAYNPNWEGTAVGPSAGNIEGSLVVFPDGRLYNVMRYDMDRCKPSWGRVLAYLVNTDDPDAPLTYSHAIAFPGNRSKFTIKYDAQSGVYWSIATRICGDEHVLDRNLLTLLYSRDMEKWEIACDLHDYTQCDHMYTGFQYVDFIIEGDDMLYLCRTALNHPHNYHDANYSMFVRLKNFRKLLPQL